MPVELNCASSLVAVHHAVTALRQGEVDLALVGGTVNAILSPGLTREMAELGMLSPEGRCKSFDASADGFVRGGRLRDGRPQTAGGTPRRPATASGG